MTMVDDWIEVGAQALAVRELVEDRGATFLGLATMVDEASDAVREAVPVVVVACTIAISCTMPKAR